MKQETKSQNKMGQEHTMLTQMILTVNGLSHAWFKKINVQLNGENISFNGNIYVHQGDIEMRLLYPQTVKESSLNMSSFDEE